MILHSTLKGKHTFLSLVHSNPANANSTSLFEPLSGLIQRPEHAFLAFLKHLAVHDSVCMRGYGGISELLFLTC